MGCYVNESMSKYVSWSVFGISVIVEFKKFSNIF